MKLSTNDPKFATFINNTASGKSDFKFKFVEEICGCLITGKKNPVKRGSVVVCNPYPFVTVSLQLREAYADETTVEGWLVSWGYDGSNVSMLIFEHEIPFYEDLQYATVDVAKKQIDIAYDQLGGFFQRLYEYNTRIASIVFERAIDIVFDDVFDDQQLLNGIRVELAAMMVESKA